MENEKEKKKNRIISICSLFIFAIALISLTFVTVNIVQEYAHNQNLLKIKQNMGEDLIYLGGIEEETEQGYYIVYADNDYVIEKEDGKVIVIYEMK